MKSTFTSPNYRAVKHTYERLKRHYSSPSTSLFVVDCVRSLHVRGIPKFRGGCEAYAHHVEFGYVLVGMGINKLNFLLMVRYSEVTL